MSLAGAWPARTASANPMAKFAAQTATINNIESIGELAREAGAQRHAAKRGRESIAVERIQLERLARNRLPTPSAQPLVGAVAILAFNNRSTGLARWGHLSEEKEPRRFACPVGPRERPVRLAARRWCVPRA